jgi:hypothetical protein
MNPSTCGSAHPRNGRHCARVRRIRRGSSCTCSVGRERSDGPGFGTESRWIRRPQAEREAECIGRRLWELRTIRLPVWDAAEGKTRAVRWQDMAILMRSPGGKTEAYAKVFERLRIPLQVARGGFYETTEVTDLLCMLQVLDNPLQDLPLLGVLRSPWVALTPDELRPFGMAEGFLLSGRRCAVSPCSIGLEGTAQPDGNVQSAGPVATAWKRWIGS